MMVMERDPVAEAAATLRGRAQRNAPLGPTTRMSIKFLHSAD